ncbi:MAG: TraM recognition domain-containing protein [Parcubacteria group bacterium]|nr:TraM recognition domain-containing protein [Parcubacteria group bacterium]MCR4342456.1 TraM recognition domain-containing protein [Patescibacteria group bacterium]
MIKNLPFNSSSIPYDIVLIALILGILLVLIYWLILFFLHRSSFKHRLIWSLNMALVEITLPHQEAEKDQTKTFKDIISVMEEFYSGMIAIKDMKGSWFEDNPYFVLEIGLPANGTEVSFFSAVPRAKIQIFEKHLHALFPSAKLREVKDDYNIFRYEGENAGAIGSLSTYDVLPIKTYDKFNADPLSTIINTFSKLKKEGEGAALQLVVSPAPNTFLLKKVKSTLDKVRKGETLSKAMSKEGWLDAVFSLIDEIILGNTPKKKDENKDPITADEEIKKLLEEKASRHILSSNIRLIASSRDKGKAESILNEIESAFLQFSAPHGNSLKFKRLKGKALRNLFLEFSFRLFNKKMIIPLNTAELTSIFHFPVGITSSPHLKQARLNEAPAPQNMPEDGVVVGENNFHGDKNLVYIGEDDRRRHLYIIGQTGTGKTSLMKNMIAQDIKEGRGVCYIDPHGSDIEDILSIIPKERIEDVIYFDPANTAMPMGLNMLEYDPLYPDQKTFVVNELLGIFNKLFDMKVAGGPMFEQYFRNATMLAIDDPKSTATLIDISRVLSDKDFRDRKIAACLNPVVKSFWRDVAEKAGGEASLSNIVPYITSKFDTFISNDVMRPILVQKNSSFNFRRIMDDQKILLINLSKGRLGDLNSNLLGLIIVGKILMASLSRVNMPERERKDFYLYIDEFQNVTTDSISTILSEARKYHLDLIVANQFIGQIEENIRKAIFGNVGSIASFRVGAEDAEFLKTQFEPTFSARDLINIDNYNAYVKLLVNGQPAKPFNLKTFAFKNGDYQLPEKIKEFSSLKYGRPRNLIEMEINENYK